MAATISGVNTGEIEITSSLTNQASKKLRSVFTEEIETITKIKLDLEYGTIRKIRIETRRSMKIGNSTAKIGNTSTCTEVIVTGVP